MELLERETQFVELKTGLTEAIQGKGSLALVSGEAGIGKTSLVHRFAQRRDPSVRLFWGVCDALFTPRPLGPLYDMAPQIGGEVAELLQADTHQGTIFSRFLDVLRRRPVIAVFEDVHWADEATLDLLRFTGRRIDQTSALLVLTYRDDELGARHPLRGLLGDLASSAVTRRIPLPPLSENAVRELVGDGVIDPVDLHSQTGGNPFYITEVLANPDRGIPASVRAAVLARAARLSASGYEVLEAAAVIGLRVEPWLLAAVVGVQARGVEECMAVGMLLAHGEELAFRHELARDTVLAAISPPRRQLLHKLVLDALKSTLGDRVDQARLAHHAEAAADREAVLAYAPSAARQAAAANAHRDAATLYALALRFAEGLEPAEKAALLEAYAHECFLLDRHEEVIAARRTAVELWRLSGNILKQGENLAYQTSAFVALGLNTEARQVSKTAIELLESEPPSRELALAYRVQATLFLVNRDCQEAISWAEKALDLADRFDDQKVRSTAHNVIGTAWLFVDYGKGCEYLERRLTSEREANQVSRVAAAYSNLGSGSGELYQFEQARRYLLDGIAFTEALDLDFQRIYMLAWLALTHLYQGGWDEAADTVREVLRRPGLSAISRIMGLIALGRLRARRGDPGALQAIDEALELAGRSGALQRLAPAHAARAEALWLAGDSGRTLEEARAVYGLALSKQHPWFAGELAFWRWKAGDPVEIPGWLAPPFALQIAGDWQAAAGEWDRLGCPYERARALADGDAEARIAALEIFEALGAQPDAERLRGELVAANAGGLPRRPRASTRENPFGLTNRQAEVLALLVKNLTNAEIAVRLSVSPKTVDHHVSAVLGKLNVRTRGEAADLARSLPFFNPQK